MEEITAKYSRFNILVNKILVDTKKELPAEAKEFLAKPIAEFIGTLKILQKQGLNVTQH